MKQKQKLPEGWTEERIKRVIDHYESQTDDEAIAKDKAAFAAKEELVQVPIDDEHFC